MRLKKGCVKLSIKSKLLFWIIVLVCFSSVAFAELPQWTEVVIQTDTTANISTIDEEFPDANIGNEIKLVIGQIGGIDKSRAYLDLKPLVCGSIPDISTIIIQNFTMRLRVTEGRDIGGGSITRFYPFGVLVNEQTVTWNNCGGTGGCGGNGTDFNGSRTLGLTKVLNLSDSNTFHNVSLENQYLTDLCNNTLGAFDKGLFMQGREDLGGVFTEFGSDDQGIADRTPQFIIHFESALPLLINSSWNVTSNNTRELSTVWNVGGRVNVTSDVVSLRVDTNIKTNMACRLNVEGNFTEISTANPDFISPTSATTIHAMTISENLDPNVDSCLYCSFINTDIVSIIRETDGGVSHSGCLQTSFVVPNLTFIAPVNNSIFNVVSDSLQVNQTCDFTNISNMNVSLINNTGGIPFFNDAFVNGFHQGNLTPLFGLSLLSTGNYNLRGECEDSFGNSVFQSLGLFLGDFTPPVVTLVTPINASNVLSSLDVSFIFNVSFPSNCTLFINNNTFSGNLTDVVFQNTFASVLLANDTTHTWNVSCVTTFGIQRNSLEFEFFLSFAVKTIQGALDEFDCPTTTAGMLILILIFGLSIFLLLFGLEIPIFGVFGGLVWIVTAFFLLSCISVVGYILIAVGTIMTFYYITIIGGNNG